MKTDSHEIAARKLDKAARLLGEYCSLTGRKAILLRVDHTPAGPGAEIITKASHEPTRHPETPLPLPSPGQTSPDSGLRHDAPSLEMERRMTAAKGWCAEMDHESGVHRADHYGAQWDIRHHAECAYETSRSLYPCDCGPLFLARVAGQIFVANADGSLERFTAPKPRPADFRADSSKFFRDQAFGIGDMKWLSQMLHDDFTFTVAGNGETERFIEMPEKIHKSETSL